MSQSSALGCVLMEWPSVKKTGSVTYSGYEDISESDFGNSTSTPVVAGPRILVNGSEVQPSTIGAFLVEQMDQGVKDTPELRSAVREELIRRELLVQEAKKKGIDKRPNIKGQIKIAEQATLNRGLLLITGRSFSSSPKDVKQQKIQEFSSSIRRSASVDVARRAVNGIVVGQDIFESFLEEDLKTPGKADSTELRNVIWEELYKREALSNATWDMMFSSIVFSSNAYDGAKNAQKNLSCLARFAMLLSVMCNFVPNHISSLILISIHKL